MIVVERLRKQKAILRLSDNIRFITEQSKKTADCGLFTLLAANATQDELPMHGRKAAFAALRYIS